jgi:ABC-2 type transport system permease protein
MKAVTIFKREMRQALITPNFYVVVGLFIAFMSFLYMNIVTIFTLNSQNASMRENFGYAELNATMFIINNLYGFMNVIMIFIIPVVTMRLFAEERREGTFDILCAHPVRDWDILLGKFFAGLAVVYLIVAMTFIYPLATVYIGGWQWGIIEWKVVASCYLGLALISAGYTAFGVFASSITENQVVASVVTFLGLLFLYLAGNLAPEATSLWAKLLGIISIQHHAETFTRGEIVLSSVVYFVLLIAGFLFCTARVLEARRWRV